jgi:broad specificity phosphatase PhoE
MIAKISEMLFLTNTVYSWKTLQTVLSNPIELDRNLTLHLVRHGKTIYNESKLYTGTTDIDLSDAGIKQSKDLGDLLDRKYDVYLCSSLKRTSQTLKYALSNLTEVYKDSRLNELFMGSLQGTSYANHLNNRVLDNPSHGGESYREGTRRVLSFLVDLVRVSNYYSFSKVLICSHAETLMLMVAILREMTTTENVFDFHIANTTICRINISKLSYPKYL